VDSVTLSDFLGSTKRDTAPLGPQVDNEAGRVTFGAFSFGSQLGADGGGALAVVTLGSRLTGESPLRLENVQMVDTRGRVQEVTIEDGRVTVGVPQRIYLPLQLARYGQPSPDDRARYSRLHQRPDGDGTRQGLLDQSRHRLCMGGGELTRSEEASQGCTPTCASAGFYADRRGG